MSSDLPETRDVWDRVAEGIFATVFSVSILFALSVWAWQLYQWLHTGSWHSLPLSKALRYLGVDLSIVYEPHSWQGLAKVARWFLAWPYSVVIPLVAILIAWGIGAAIQAESQKASNTVNRDGML